MKRFAAVVLAAFLVVLTAPFTSAAEQAADSPRLRLSVTQMNPRVINGNSTTLNITGTVTNIGDRRISELQARLELGDRMSSERQIRTAMSGTSATGSSLSRFLDLSPATLEPGQSAPLNITVKLDGSAGNLRVSNAGIYPLLVNVNGTPDYGGQARLASLSMLLPVLGAPGKSSSPVPDRPAQVTMLWPIADTRPRLVAAPFGGQSVLGDDMLAAELRPGGRLDALVASALAVRDDPELSRTLCYAVDPDLLDTVDAMSRGYQVRTASGNVPGSGADAAKTWLDSLRRLVANQCVVQMPYADADLPALARVRGGDLMGYALNTAQHVQNLIGTRPQAGVLWAEGPLDDKSLTALDTAGIKTLIADPSQLSGNVTSGVGIAGSAVRAEPVDSLVTTGLNGTGSDSSAATAVDDPAIGTQNGLAALAYRGMNGDAGKSVLVAPPRRWDVPETELTQLLQTMGELFDRRLLTGVALPQVLAMPASGTARMSYTAEDVAGATPASVTDSMATIENTMADVRSAMTVDPTAQVDPDQLLLPLRYALVRNTSTAWRTTKGAAEGSAADSRAELDALLRGVTVDSPSVPISMASGSSPLPVFLHNTLPVQVAVRIIMNNSTGLRFGNSPDQLLPAGLSRNIPIQVEALRAGRFNLTVSLSTPGGTALGTPARFELRSNEYGVITLVLTIAGGAAVVLLSGRQIYRRIRSRRAK
ncbi:hypothetical protein HFP15_10320 [Amycolatopsis sp. K13G38]|uniref:Glycoprotein n=1 Tax=Amycolatopsis acididurans TaxID=2724524 RepID=A0ABX1J0H2_9PSEU|nr:DUF6049 family protein [Amycolatopsis acididurans]NKQ53277.1 hypothetical protein [Amycolatopsis acididurans]